MINLRELVNPYDFANPVGDDRSFFGRTTEIADTIYYLNQAQLTRRPIHLAFVGARASGKTSFLNIAELEAKRKGFCTVRINLNEGDVETDFEFFRKLFHSILMAAFGGGAFGGKKSSAYFSYLSLVATNEIVDTEQLPLIFAFQLAHAAKAKNLSFHVADDILSEDLKTIAAELKKPIIVLFDECNVLRANCIILEKLRNIFMNMTDYMLVFAATEDFFPVMDEVFSPIMRQFKKIEIGPFKSYLDVRDCITKPMLNAGMPRADLKRLVPRMFINDADTLSGRRPYEIQLICHTLFKRCQDGSAKRFGLDLVTIQTIQNELASGQNIDQRPIIKAAKHLHRKTLSALSLVAASSTRLSTDDWWSIEYGFKSTTKWTEDSFRQAITDLLDAGLLEERSGQLWFSGDDLDRIYLKYLAHQKGVALSGGEVPFEVLIMRLLVEMLSSFPAIEPIGATATADKLDDISNLTKILAVDDTPLDDLKALNATPWTEDLLAKFLQMDSGNEVQLYEFFIERGTLPVQIWFFWSESRQIAQLKKMTRVLNEFKQRCLEVGFNVSWRSWPIKTPEPKVLAARITELNNEQIATRLGLKLTNLVTREYVEEKNATRAMELATIA